jgi:hypothetical protein
MKLYRYVGPEAVAERVRGHSSGRPVRSVEDVINWVVAEQDVENESDGVVAAFVVDADGQLRIIDRRHDHAECTGAGPVLFAGEMKFIIHNESVLVVDVTNQATGYCPEPESWPVVHAALLAAGLQPPRGLRLACVFRRCPKCNSLNLVKDRNFVCDACAARLPLIYNVQA